MSNDNEHLKQQKDTITSEEFFVDDPVGRVSKALPENRRSVIKAVTEEIARKSTAKRADIEKYLKMNHYDRDSEGSSSDGDYEVREEMASQFLKSSQRGTDLDDQFFTKFINRAYRNYVRNLITVVLSQHGVDHAKWFDKIFECTQKTVKSVRPSSIMLNDSIDLNEYVQVVLTQSKEPACEYVNGIVC